VFLRNIARCWVEAPCGHTWMKGMVCESQSSHPTCFAEALWSLDQPIEKHRGPGEAPFRRNGGDSVYGMATISEGGALNGDREVVNITIAMKCFVADRSW